MIIENIEKYSELSFVQENKAQSRAALQSCLYNLNNLKALIEKNTQSAHNISYPKHRQSNKQNNRVTLSNLRLPQISQPNQKNRQFTNNSNSHANANISRLSISKNQNFSKFLSYNNRSYSNINYHDGQSYRNKKVLTCQQLKKKYINQQSKLNNNNKGKQLQRKPSIEKTKSLQPQFRKKKLKLYKPLLVLSKDQKYFQDSEVKVSQQMINKLGLYQATNLYKRNNIDKFLKLGYQNNFKPVINLKFATFSLCNRNQFFLTDNYDIPELNQADCLEQQLSNQQNANKNINKNNRKNKKYNDLKTVSQQSNIKKSYDKIVASQQNQTQNNNQTHNQNSNQNAQNSKIKIQLKQINWTLTIQSYEVVKNQQFFKFKRYNIEDWSQLKFILHGICQYLKKIKISLLSFKFQKELFMKQLWSCRRFKQKSLQKLLKIRLHVKNVQNKQQSNKPFRLFSSKVQVIKQLAIMWKDRQYLQKMRKQKQKRMQRLVWVASRIIGRHKIRIQKKKRSTRAAMLNQKLKNGDWDYQVQIHIPSFTQSQFVRNTTQYMQHYQNMFYHMWKGNNKQFILILPAINQILLSVLQEKIKVSKNIVIICPDSHQLYPKSLPLSACLLYSKDALYKIKKLIDGRKAIIIPGRKTSNKFLYQEHLSNLLNCPLFSTLNVSNLLGDHKQIWLKHQIPTTSFTIIQPNSNIKTIIQNFSQLICQHPTTKLWVLKINEQFNGRGIAKFDVSSSKKLKQIISLFQINKNQSEQKNNGKVRQKNQEQIKKFIIQYLETHFRLRLKVNFQNCIFRVEEYINMLLEKGGIIEEYVQECETYEICYKLQPGYSNYQHLYILDQVEEQKYICCTQNYQVDFVTKSSIFLAHENVPKIVQQFSKKAQKLLKSQKYLGHISVTLIHSQKTQQIYAIQIKPYMTLNSSMGHLLKVLTNKKINQLNTTSRRNGNLNSPSSTISRGQLQQSPNRGLLFLFVPYIVFTDVDEVTRSQVIQELVIESWDKLSLKSFSNAVTAQNLETFQGTIYLSLGLTLGMLVYGKTNDLKKMKTLAAQNSRQLSERIQNIKLYRGKQETRDVFQYGDLIRAITKIK